MSVPSSSPDPWHVLGVSLDCSVEDVKNAYRKRVLEVHPDVNMTQDARKAKEEFVKLTTAYRILTTPGLRAEYLLRRRGLRVNSGSAAGVNFGAEAKARFNAGLRRRRGWESRHDADGANVNVGPAVEELLSWASVNLLQPLRKEFDEALLKAYLGPVLDPSIRYPWAFELEERSSECASDRVVEITSGQTLLGYVRVGEAQHALPLHPASKPRQQAGPNFRPLELWWKGELEARAIRYFDAEDDEMMVFGCSMQLAEEVLHAGQPAGAVDGTKGAIPPCFGVVRGLHARSSVSVQSVECPPKGTTHHVFSYSTPGVKHMLYMLSNRPGTVECKAVRGWLPPSSLWYFPPRSSSHDIGGWYIERALGKDGRAGLLHPTVPIFACAYRVLDGEVHKRGSSRLTKALDALKKYVKNVV